MPIELQNVNNRTSGKEDDSLPVIHKIGPMPSFYKNTMNTTKLKSLFYS